MTNESFEMIQVSNEFFKKQCILRFLDKTRFVEDGLYLTYNSDLHDLYIMRNKHSEHLQGVKKHCYDSVNPQAPVAQKVADEVVFRRFGGEGVEFFKIGPH